MANQSKKNKFAESVLGERHLSNSVRGHRYLNDAYQLVIVNDEYKIPYSQIVKGFKKSKVRNIHHLQENFSKGSTPLILPFNYTDKSLVFFKGIFPWEGLPVMTLKEQSKP